MFIGRKAEINFLNERYQSPNAELIVLYGRRRVGKTWASKRKQDIQKLICLISCLFIIYNILKPGDY